uniref:Transposase n=2 Tax=Candidatus Kentrum sp. TUN TaxID=2126343 RepID=A0A451A8X1_9GAMM|nr:MAG: hypothetical protein BECKTUN1418D_GA0071000_11766 [Candidatus Kentron sp. TUN]
MNEQELSEYCRENGLYVEQIERWREFAIAGTESGSLLTKGQRQEWQRDKKRLCNIEKELRRKEKALAGAKGRVFYSNWSKPLCLNPLRVTGAVQYAYQRATGNPALLHGCIPMIEGSTCAYLDN